jgi:LAS superfamily LD-carboxypeptidase LdcB
MAKKKTIPQLPEPVGQIRLDDNLRKWGNGTIPESQLAKIHGGGRLYKPAAIAFNKMWEDAKKENITLLGVSEGYRSLKAQEALFFRRYSKMPTSRIPSVTRTYLGKKWYLKRGMSPSATPATSPHGWGLAQDLNVQDPKVFTWLCNNAPKYGFYLQGRKYLPNGKKNPEYEAWHWQFCNL